MSARLGLDKSSLDRADLTEGLDASVDDPFHGVGDWHQPEPCRSASFDRVPPSNTEPPNGHVGNEQVAECKGLAAIGSAWRFELKAELIVCSLL